MRLSMLKAMITAAPLALLVACGGSPETGVNVTDKAVACETPLTQARSGVAATVGGQYHYYSGDARYTAAGLQRSLAVEDLFDHQASWQLTNVTPALGTYRCGDIDAPYIALTRDGATLDSALGECEVEVTEVSEQGLRGRFSSVLQAPAGGPERRVDDGCFTVVFSDAILDADLDGLADADDGCPFDAANDCAEQPANINSCAVDQSA